MSQSLVTQGCATFAIAHVAAPWADIEPPRWGFEVTIASNDSVSLTQTAIARLAQLSRSAIAPATSIVDALPPMSGVRAAPLLRTSPTARSMRTAARLQFAS